MDLIDLNSLIPGQPRFRWSDALFLPQWNLHVFPNQTQYDNIIKLAKILFFIENRVGKPVNITCWLRPNPYNTLVGGAPGSFHQQGGAVDFVVVTRPSSEIRFELEPELERLKIRMENKNTPHVHVDIKDPKGGSRYFIP